MPHRKFGHGQPICAKTRSEEKPGGGRKKIESENIQRLIPSSHTPSSNSPNLNNNHA